MPFHVAASALLVGAGAVGAYFLWPAAAGPSALLVGAGAVGAYFLWPAAAGPADAGALMKAPGGSGFFISRVAFKANPQRYYNILRTAGPEAAAAAFR